MTLRAVEGIIVETGEEEESEEDAKAGDGEGQNRERKSEEMRAMSVEAIARVTTIRPAIPDLGITH